MAQADLKFKAFPPVANAQPPERMTEGAVGFDFYAEEIINEDRNSIWYRTGYGVDLPNGNFGDLRARSSVSKMGLILANGAGVVDTDYQGEIQFRFYKLRSGCLAHPEVAPYPDFEYDGEGYRRHSEIEVYEPGDRIGQMIVVPEVSSVFTGTEVVEEFESETERAEGGFGSTGE